MEMFCAVWRGNSLCNLKAVRDCLTCELLIKLVEGVFSHWITCAILRLNVKLR